MQSAKLFKKFLMPCGLCAAVPVITPVNPPKECNGTQCKRLIRPSELPLYSPEEPLPQDSPRGENAFPLLEDQVKNVRESFQTVINQYQHITDSVSTTIDTGIAHSKSTIDYLRDENNILPRVGAIGAGGLTGLVLGIRGGKFKKLVYITTGAGVMAAGIYPNQAKEALNLATYYANIGYNFIYGVKPGAEGQQKFELPELPKLPSSFSELVDITVDLGAAAVATAGNLVGSAYKSLTQAEEAGPSEKAEKKD